MVAVIMTLLVLVLTMTSFVEQMGVTLGSTVDQTRGQVIDWILT